MVFLASAIAMVFVLRRIIRNGRPTRDRTHGDLFNVLTAVSINLTASIAIRNEHVINMLFRLFVTHVSPRMSLSIRRVFAKVYNFGGVHSGGGVAAAIWYGIYTAVSTSDYVDSIRSLSQNLDIILTAVIWCLMCGLLTAACPRIRAKIHDWFEISHRFFGSMDDIGLVLGADLDSLHLYLKLSGWQSRDSHTSVLGFVGDDSGSDVSVAPREAGEGTMRDVVEPCNTHAYRR
jgi:hypothetical protein